VEVGVVDEIVPEPTGGAHRDPEQLFTTTGQAIAQVLHDLQALSVPDLLEARLRNLDQVGIFDETPAPTSVAAPTS